MKTREVRIGEWYTIKGLGANSFILFEQPVKIRKIIKRKFFMVYAPMHVNTNEHEYTISNYLFCHKSKADCEERERLQEEICSIKQTARKKISSIVEKLKKIDDNQNIIHWDNKYGGSV